MIAYVSALSNGHQNYSFKEPVIDQQVHDKSSNLKIVSKFEKAIFFSQAKAERCNPVKPALESIFADHRLICCRTAMDDFLAIVKLVGGPEEKERAREFVSDRITEIVADQESERVASLAITAQIKPRSKVIFGTGDFLKVRLIVYLHKTDCKGSLWVGCALIVLLALRMVR